jgi:hypothetical protein
LFGDSIGIFGYVQNRFSIFLIFFYLRKKLKNKGQNRSFLQGFQTYARANRHCCNADWPEPKTRQRFSHIKRPETGDLGVFSQN